MRMDKLQGEGTLVYFQNMISESAAVDAESYLGCMVIYDMINVSLSLRGMLRPQAKLNFLIN